MSLANAFVKIDPHKSIDYCEYEKLGREITDALTKIRTAVCKETAANSAAA